MRFFSPSEQSPDEKTRWNKILWAIGLGIFVGEVTFLLIYTAGEDFWQHYFTAQALIGGLPAETIQDIWPPRYVYPYLTFLPRALVPLSVLPPRLALTIWVALLYLAMGAAVYLLATTFPHFTRLRAAAAALWFAIWPVTFVAVFMGQVSPFILLILVVAYRLGKNGSDLASGLVLSLGLLKPHLMIGVVGALALRAKWRIVLGFTLGSLVILGISLSSGQMGSASNWFRYVTEWFLSNDRSVSIVGRLHFLPWQLQLMVTLLGMGLLAFWWWRRSDLSSYDAALGFLASLSMVPYVLIYDLVLLAPLFLLLIESKDLLFWASILVAALASLRYGLGDLAAVSMVLLGLALWRNRDRLRWPVS